MEEQVRSGSKPPGPQESLADIGKNESGPVTIPSPKQKFLLVKPFPPGLVQGPGKLGDEVQECLPRRKPFPVCLAFLTCLSN